MKTYCLYARVSPKGSTWSANETSIGVQFADMREHVLRIDPTAQFVEIFDEFKSGKNLNRAGIQQILADLSKNPCPWQCLVVWNLDRLSRSLVDAIPIFSRLRDTGCEFISVNQAYLSYTGAMARYMLHQTIALAELERGMTSERVSAKMRYIASEGKIPWGNIPLGYVRDPKLKNTVVIDEPRAEIIRTVFDLYISGNLGYDIINNRWPGVFKDRAHIYRILRNPLYVGELHYAGKIYQTEHPAIIERAVFDKAQELLASRRRNYKKLSDQTYDYLLSGLVRCHCGRQMTGYSVHGKSGQKFFYYKCTDPKCKNAINAETLDSGVLNQIAAVYRDKNEIQKSVEAFMVAQKEKQAAEKNKRIELEKQQFETKEKLSRIKDMFLSGVVNKENAAFWNAELENARLLSESLEKEIAELSAVPEIEIDDIFPELMKAAEGWIKKIALGEADFATRRNLVMSTVESLQCVSRSANRIEFCLKLVMTNSIKWWALRDSNPRHSRCKRDALTN